jgi:hypothetical protein
MSQVFPMRYLGDGMFRCLRTKSLDIEPQSVHGWQMAEHRSAKSHDHFFAIINEAWKNLPEDLADDFPSSEHLRKWALIKAGFCTEAKIVCANNDTALTLVSEVKAMDKFALIAIDGKLVTIWRAASQRKDAMGKAEFQEAKERALHIISELIGTDATTLRNAA